MTNPTFEEFLSGDGLARLQREFGKYVDSDWLRQASETVAAIGLWPAADVYETDTAMVIELDMPGVDSDAVEISVLDGRLTVSGERHGQAESTDDVTDSAARYRLRERRRGRFSREFAVPSHADESAISATNRQGVYTVTIPYRQDRVARRVPVEAD